MNKTVFKRCTELFPELKDETNINRYIDFISTTDDLKDFVRDCFTVAGKEITEYENKVCEILLDSMIKKGLLDTDNHQIYVDTMLVSALLHNTYFDDEDILGTLFKPRDNFDSVADKYEIPEQFREAIWDGVEGQLGDMTPIAKIKPSPNTPQDLLANSIWIVRNFLNWFFVEEKEE